MVKKMYNDKNSLQHIFIFIFGLICGLKLTLFGEIYVGEIVAIIFSPLYLIFRKISKNELYFLLACFLWSICQILSDIVNNTNFQDSLKGTLTPLVFLATILFYFIFLKKGEKSLALFLLGICFISIIQMLVLPSDYQKINIWKFGLGLMTLNVILIYFSFLSKGNKLNLFIAFLIFLIVSMVNDYRSMAFFPILGYLLYNFFQKRQVNLALSKFTIIKIIIPLVVSVILINFIAAKMFESGYLNGVLPSEVDQKFRSQATSDVGLILAGRSESLISLRAFMDAPFFGHGSWAKDYRYVDEYILLRFKYGLSNEIVETDKELIPTHSYIMGSAVWYGFMGILIWLFITNLVLKNYFRYATKLPIYFHVGIILFLWNLLFSPFGADARWNTGLFFAVFFVFIWHQKEHANKYY